LYKIVIILYLICFGLYVLFSRQPDFFDSEFANATIHFVKDSSSGQTVPKAIFSIASQQFLVDASYLFRKNKEGETVRVIYEASDPQSATVYMVWGYWIRWGEVIVSVVLLIVLFQIAVAITSNPTPEGLMSEMEGTPPKKRRYEE
jgi:hypothetical protein